MKVAARAPLSSAPRSPALSSNCTCARSPKVTSPTTANMTDAVCGARGEEEGGRMGERRAAAAEQVCVRDAARRRPATQRTSVSAYSSQVHALPPRAMALSRAGAGGDGAAGAERAALPEVSSSLGCAAAAGGTGRVLDHCCQLRAQAKALRHELGTLPPRRRHVASLAAAGRHLNQEAAAHPERRPCRLILTPAGIAGALQRSTAAAAAPQRRWAADALPALSRSASGSPGSPVHGRHSAPPPPSSRA